MDIALHRRILCLYDAAIYRLTALFPNFKGSAEGSLSTTIIMMVTEPTLKSFIHIVLLELF